MGWKIKSRICLRNQNKKETENMSEKGHCGQPRPLISNSPRERKGKQKEELSKNREKDMTHLSY